MKVVIARTPAAVHINRDIFHWKHYAAEQYGRTVVAVARMPSDKITIKLCLDENIAPRKRWDWEFDRCAIVFGKHVWRNNNRRRKSEGRYKFTSLCCRAQSPLMSTNIRFFVRKASISIHSIWVPPKCARVSRHPTFSPEPGGNLISNPPGNPIGVSNFRVN